MVKALKPTRAAAALLLLPLVLCAGRARAQQKAGAEADVPSLVAAALKNGEAMSRRVFEYSWATKTQVRHMNKRGRVVRETSQGHEAYPLPGRSFVVQKLVSENGRALAPKRAAKEQQRVESELRHAELVAATFSDNLKATEEITGCTAFGIWTTLTEAGGKLVTLGVSDFLCFGEFGSPRVERRNGREAVVLTFRPRAGFKPPSSEKAAFSKLVGMVWIDAADRVVSRVEAWAVDDPRAADPRRFAASEAAVVFEDQRLPTGMWARGLRYVNTSKNPAAFNGLNMEWRQEFTDYRRYYTEVREYQFESPQKSQTQQTPTPREP